MSMDRMLKVVFRSTKIALMKMLWTFMVILEGRIMRLMKMAVEKLKIMAFFLTDAIKDGGFQYTPSTASL